MLTGLADGHESRHLLRVCSLFGSVIVWSWSCFSCYTMGREEEKGKNERERSTMTATTLTEPEQWAKSYNLRSQSCSTISLLPLSLSSPSLIPTKCTFEKVFGQKPGKPEGNVQLVKGEKREEGEPDLSRKENTDKKKWNFFFRTISWLQNFDETSFHDFSFAFECISRFFETSHSLVTLYSWILFKMFTHCFRFKNEKKIIRLELVSGKVTHSQENRCWLYGQRT